MIRIFEMVKDGIFSKQTEIFYTKQLTIIPRKDERIYLQTTKMHYKVKSIVHDVEHNSIDICVER